MEKWYLDRGEGFLFFSNNRSLVSLLKYRGRDKVRLIRRLKRVNEQLSLLHRCDPEPRALRFHETLRFLKYIKKAGETVINVSNLLRKNSLVTFNFFFFFFPSRRIRILLLLQTHLTRDYELQERKSEYSFDYISLLNKTYPFSFD